VITPVCGVRSVRGGIAGDCASVAAEALLQRQWLQKINFLTPMKKGSWLVVFLQFRKTLFKGTSRRQKLSGLGLLITMIVIDRVIANLEDSHKPNGV
jgi:hypothetical protein